MIRRLVADGVPQRQVARQLGIGRSTVARAVASDRPPKYERQPVADVVHAVRAAGAGAVGGVSGDAGDGDRRAGRLDGVDHVVPGERRVGCGLSTAASDPADRLTWAPGDAAQCDLWFPPRRIPLEDGTTALLPVLVITAAHSRFIAGRMIPTRKTEDLLLGIVGADPGSWAGCRGG